MMGTKTYCPTHKISHKMMKIFGSIPGACFQVTEFPVKKHLTLCRVSKSSPYQSSLQSIKIP
jgi:hypothetical protein